MAVSEFVIEITTRKRFGFSVAFFVLGVATRLGFSPDAMARILAKHFLVVESDRQIKPKAAP